MDSADAGSTVDSADSAVDTAPEFPGLHLVIPVRQEVVDDAWQARVDAAAATGGSLLVDIKSGPGDQKSSAWTTAIAAARAAHVPVLGYVNVQGGSRDPDDVARDLGRWGAWYSTDGAWFGAPTGDCEASAAAYVALAALADAYDADHDALVAIEAPDGGCAGVYAVSDQLVTVTTGAALGTLTMPEWRSAEAADRFSFWVTDVAEGDLAAALGAMTAQHAAGVYVTDQPGSAPFSALPSYWAAEVGAVGG